MIGVESSRVMRAAPRKAVGRVEASVPWDFSRKYAAVHHSGTISVENARKRSKIGRVMKVETFETPQDAAKALAGEVAELIRTRAAEGKNVVLGLATGATPLPFYAELVRMHKEEGLSFANVISFNLDEYSGLDRDHPESYWYFMHTNLFNHIDIKPENINLPSGTVKDDEIAAHCAAYEQKIKDCGGIDLQILGIGRTGHIGFNEPGSDDTTVTRQVHLDELTRSDAAPAFGGIENVPPTAITMGVATIMGAREVALMAWGEKKASIVKKAVQGPVTVDVAASYLQKHPNAKFLLDKGAASLL